MKSNFHCYCNGRFALPPFDAKDSLTLRAPHGEPFAVINTDGVVKLNVPGGYIVDQTDMKSPKAYSSEDGAELVVYNNKKAVIYFTRPDTIRGKEHRLPPTRMCPPNGISFIGVSEDGIIVTGSDNKQTRYDFDGNEIKQETLWVFDVRS